MTSLALAGVQIIGICGKAGSGKSVLARALEVKGFWAYSFSAPLKAMLVQLPYLEDIFTGTREWKEAELRFYGKSPRQMMQTLGTDWARQMVHPDIWVHIMEYKIKRKAAACKKFVIDDVRFDNEAGWIRDHGGLVVHLHRDGVATVNPHSSEKGVTQHPDDWILYNDKSLAELKEKAETLVTGVNERMNQYLARSTKV